jgi:orotate phosphoribosyltransferase
MPKQLDYRSYADLARHCALLARRVPCDIDLVVGIPRSGLLAATMIALYLNRQLADLEGYLEGRFIKGGYRTRHDEGSGRGNRRKVLVVDDSVFTGNALRAAKEQLLRAALDDELVFAAVYVAPNRTDLVDFHADVVETPRVFDWNVMNHPLMAHACVDIDGVLCRDPTNEENDDSANYMTFLTSVGATTRIPGEIGCLVTSRLERYRPETEAWLAKHGISYRRLVMSNYLTAEERRKARRHALDKADVYRDEAYHLFIESSVWQAAQIADATGKCVYCVDERRMVFPADGAVQRRALRLLRTKVWKGIRNPQWAVRRIVQGLQTGRI